MENTEKGIFTTKGRKSRKHEMQSIGGVRHASWRGERHPMRRVPIRKWTRPRERVERHQIQGRKRPRRKSIYNAGEASFLKFRDLAFLDFRGKFFIIKVFYADH
jgi:hypothetical protein